VIFIIIIHYTNIRHFHHASIVILIIICVNITAVSCSDQWRQWPRPPQKALECFLVMIRYFKSSITTHTIETYTSNS